MPVYEYACTECDEQLEVRQSFTDDALTVCPVCDGRLRKVLNAVGVVFKGSGFYRTDSRAAAAGAGSGSGTTTSSPDKAGDKDSPSTNGATKESGTGSKESASTESGGKRSGAAEPAPKKSASKDSGSNGPAGREPAVHRAG